MDEEASALLQRELPAYFAKWRGLDMLFGYAAMHAQNSTVLSHLRTLAERLANVNNATLADRYLHGDDDDDGGGDYSGGTSTHLSAVFSCEGHADLCERWSSGVASESFVDFQAHAADISGGDVADDSGARSATSPIRDRLCIVLLVDGHVKDAASRLPLCCIELGHASTTTTSPAASSITLQAAPTANPAVVGTAAADRWKAATMKVQRHAKTAAAFAVSHTLDIMLRNLLQLEAAGGAASAAETAVGSLKPTWIMWLATLKSRVDIIVKHLQQLKATDVWAQLLHDMKDLNASLGPSLEDGSDDKDWKIGITDDPNVLFMIGTDVGGSCQHAGGTPSLNKCLMGYVLDGKTKAVVISRPGEHGVPVTIARCIVRLLLADGGREPVLAISRIYLGNKFGSRTKVFGRALLQYTAKEAARLGVRCVSSADSGGVESLGGVGPEYVDGGGIADDAVWELECDNLENNS